MAPRLESAADEPKTLTQEFLHRLDRVLENPASLEARILYSDAFDALKTAPEQTRIDFRKRLAPLTEADSHGDHADRQDATAELSPRAALAKDTANMWKSPEQRAFEAGDGHG